VRLLLDTHVLIWLLDDPAQVSAAALAAIQPPTHEVLLSAATIWELSIKVGQGKLAL
jgi:PIN domain nuclease of toxin-antitoxin system